MGKKDIFTSILNEAAPKRDIKIKKHTEPWMTSEIIELIQKRDLLLNIYKKKKKIVNIFITIIVNAEIKPRER